MAKMTEAEMMVYFFQQITPYVKETHEGLVPVIDWIVTNLRRGSKEPMPDSIREQWRTADRAITSAARNSAIANMSYTDLHAAITAFRVHRREILNLAAYHVCIAIGNVDNIVAGIGFSIEHAIEALVLFKHYGNYVIRTEKTYVQRCEMYLAAVKKHIAIA